MIGVVCTRFTFVIGVDGQEFALSRPTHVWVKYYEPFCNYNCTASEKLAAISMTKGQIVFEALPRGILPHRGGYCKVVGVAS